MLIACGLISMMLLPDDGPAAEARGQDRGMQGSIRSRCGNVMVRLLPFLGCLELYSERFYADPGLQVKATYYLNAMLDQEGPPRPPGTLSGLSMQASRPSCRHHRQIHTCRRREVVLW
jgi:hypothetical protein